VKYVAINAHGESAIEIAPKPPELLRRCMAAPSALAKILNTKFCDGVSLYQIERMHDRWGFPIDRGTMSRWVEQLGAAFGTTIIEAARKDAFANAFCIMTDATGFAIQPGPSEDGKRRPCRKGHYFVQNHRPRLHVLRVHAEGDQRSCTRHVPRVRRIPAG
jgi:hypothetical protein